jgi:hypothetical protein
MRKQKSVAVLPIWIFRFEFHGMAIRHSQHIRVSERLAYITLALNFTHLDGITPNPVGAISQSVISWFLLHRN